MNNKDRILKSNHVKGRPRLPAATIDKILYAYSIGANNTEAAAYADISQSTLYKYIKEDPTLADKIARFKVNPVLKAKQCVYDSIIAGDDVSARWYLERRAPGEFGSRQSIDITASSSLSIDDRAAALRDFLRRFE